MVTVQVALGNILVSQLFLRFSGDKIAFFRNQSERFSNVYCYEIVHSTAVILLTM